MPELLLYAAICLVVLTIVGVFAAIVWLFFTPDREDGFTDEEEA